METENRVSEAQYFSSTVGFSILRSEHLLQIGSNVLFWNQFYGICPLTLLLQLAATSMKWNINLPLASLCTCEIFLRHQIEKGLRAVKLKLELILMKLLTECKKMCLL